MAYQVGGTRVEWNPTAARLRELTEEMPNSRITEFGNVAVRARADSRSTQSTYIVEDSTNSRGQTISRTEYDRVAAIQYAHIAKSHMVAVDSVPGADPFFPRDMADMGNRMLELLDSHEVQSSVLNTGRVGGRDDQLGSKKVTISCSSAIMRGIVEGSSERAEDPDFGYEVATAVPGADDMEILQPRLLYARQARADEHDAMVARLKREHREFPGLTSPSLSRSADRRMLPGTPVADRSVPFVGYVSGRSSRC